MNEFVPPGAANVTSADARVKLVTWMSVRASVMCPMGSATCSSRFMSGRERPLARRAFSFGRRRSWFAKRGGGEFKRC